MDSDKGLLVPVNYNERWKTYDDDCWKYVGLNNRYVRVKASTTYIELIHLIFVETGINRDDNIIEVHGWMSYPVKEMSPPFLLMKDTDISTFIELNAKQDFVVPLCISTSSKPKSSRPPNVEVLHCQKLSVNQPVKAQYGFEMVELDDCEMVRLDDIKFTNPIDGLKVDDVMEEHDSNNEDNDDEEYDDEDDGFGRRGPFDYDYDEEDDGYVRRDPFEHAVEFDSYFRVYLESHPLMLVNLEENEGLMSLNLEENEGSTPPLAENHICVEEYSNPPPDSQGNSAPADENTPIQKGTKRSRGTPQGKKIVSSDAQSTNIHVMQDFKVGEIVKSKAELIVRARVQSVKHLIVDGLFNLMRSIIVAQLI
ncbi:hypothetical protein LIER_02252 [Lithospermum erythrorhizon]|uniref:Uncharacterized protein n=1 Tax=Lithospermum erythrorhizon TaxID=34254 RepID=A0AAV3NNU4_LITER